MPDINEAHRAGIKLDDLKAAADLAQPIALADPARAAKVGLDRIEALWSEIGMAQDVGAIKALMIGAQLDQEFVHAAGYAWQYRRLDTEVQLNRIGSIPKMAAQTKMLRKVIEQAAATMGGQTEEIEEELPPVESLKLATPPVVQHGKDYWLLDDDGTYLPVSGAVLGMEVERVHKVSCWAVNADGKRRLLSAPEIYGKVGKTAKEIRWTCLEAEASWDEARRVLTIPGGRLQDGPARESAAVHKWLTLGLGDRLGAVLDWVVGLAHPELPCAALTICGPPSAGKSMFGTAVAALYGGYVDYFDVMNRFNDGLKKHPFIWLDERAPKDGDPSIFRKIIGNSTHRIEAKHHPVQQLIGHLRLLATSNHPDPFRLADDNLVANDDDAIGKRIVFAEISAAAGHYLEALGGRRATDGWCDPDGELTCHLRWIIQTRKVEPGGRLWIDGDAGEYMSRIGTQGGMPGVVLDAIARYMSLDSHERAQIADRCPFRFDDAHPNAVIVSAPKLISVWSVLVGGTHSPDASKVRGALQRVTRGPEKHYRLANGERVRGYRVARSALGERVDMESWPLTHEAP